MSCLWFGSKMDGQTMKQDKKVKEKADKKSKRDKPLSSAKPARPTSETVQQSDDNRCQIFTYQELAMGTNNFSMESMIGRGGFGAVYKGKITSGQAIKAQSKFKNVAVKVLDKSGVQGDKEFLVEILMLSFLHHDNLVKLLGYCAEGDHRLIVYEYMPLGSLQDCIHDHTKPLDWLTRMEIAAGAARGLDYLHNGTEDPHVIYRDLKTANILLNHEYKPKLSDFGLAELGLPTGDMTHAVSTHKVMGTHGYCAPEYARSGKWTFKSDIYSFGVVLLELITGRKAIMDSSYYAGPSCYLVHWAHSLYTNRKIKQIVDPRLSIGRELQKGLWRTLSIAIMCVDDDADTRPSISEIVVALDYIVESILRTQRKRKVEGLERGIELKETTETVMSSAKLMTINEENEEEDDEFVERNRHVAQANAWAESWRVFRR